MLLENYPPGKLDALGLGYATLSAANPRLVYCSITGYGPRGPKCHRLGYDVVASAESGLMHVTGPKVGQRRGGEGKGREGKGGERKGGERMGGDGRGGEGRGGEGKGREGRKVVEEQEGEGRRREGKHFIIVSALEHMSVLCSLVLAG